MFVDKRGLMILKIDGQKDHIRAADLTANLSAQRRDASADQLICRQP